MAQRCLDCDWWETRDSSKMTEPGVCPECGGSNLGPLHPADGHECDDPICQAVGRGHQAGWEAARRYYSPAVEALREIERIEHDPAVTVIARTALSKVEEVHDRHRRA